MTCVVIVAAEGSIAPRPGPLPPDTDQQTRILADAAAYSANHAHGLPNFICTQTTQRFVDFTGKSGYRPVDLIVESLTYFDNHENYTVVMMNGRSVNLSHAELGGAISSGEFGSLLTDIFSLESETMFTWENFYKLRGRLMHVFSYRVPAAQSAFHLRVPNLDLVTGYHGLIFIDDQTHFVHRITQHADAIPSDYPVQDPSIVLDYEYTKIDNHEYLLPFEFELRLRDGTHLIRNDVRFDDYRMFDAKTNIRFDPPASDKSQKD